MCTQYRVGGVVFVMLPHIFHSIYCATGIHRNTRNTLLLLPSTVTVHHSYIAYVRTSTKYICCVVCFLLIIFSYLLTSLYLTIHRLILRNWCDTINHSEMKINCSNYYIVQEWGFFLSQNIIGLNTYVLYVGVYCAVD